MISKEESFLIVKIEFVQKGLILVSLWMLFFWGLPDKGYSQDFEWLKQTLDEADKKLVDKAIGQLLEAGALSVEANEKYSLALSYQESYELDEKTLQRKLGAAEGKALALQEKADKKYASAYKSLYDLCSKNLSALIASENSSIDPIGGINALFKQANDKRKQADNSKSPYEKALLLNEAAELEGNAIENLILAIQSQLEDSPAFEEDYSNSQIEYPAEIDKKITHSGQENTEEPKLTNVEKETSETELTMDASEERIYKPGDNWSIDSSDISSKQQIENIETGLKEDVFEPSLKATDDSNEIENGVPKAVDRNMTEIESNFSHPEISSQGKLYPANESEITEKETIHTEGSQGYQTLGIQYVVQLAASKFPPTPANMKSIYQGTLTVEIVQEDIWYKYRITGFKQFSDANRIALSSGVASAWVLAFNEGSEISLPEARKFNQKTGYDPLLERQGNVKLGVEKDYYVQVFASRHRVSKEKINMLCGYSGKCREIIEDGWIKYQLYAGNTYAKAIELNKNIEGKSFIVSYRQGQKQ